MYITASQNKFCICHYVSSYLISSTAIDKQTFFGKIFCVNYEGLVARCGTQISLAVFECSRGERSVGHSGDYVGHTPGRSGQEGAGSGS